MWPRRGECPPRSAGNSSAPAATVQAGRGASEGIRLERSYRTSAAEVVAATPTAIGTADRGPQQLQTGEPSQVSPESALHAVYTYLSTLPPRAEGEPAR